MARGWESKAVESQVEDRRAADVERRLESDQRADAEREELERKQKRESLERSKRRVMSDLATATSDVHKAALQNALAFLESELARLR